MNPPLYFTSFSLKTLDHLGINLYGNAAAVIAELIANAHDAGAKRVDITVSPGKIIVQDDGIGMSLEDINSKYLRFGYEKRRSLTTLTVSRGKKSVERHVMGRKGIGKISALSIAKEIEVQTVKDNEKHAFVIERDSIQELQETNSIEYNPRALSSNAVTISKGTRVELRQTLPDVTGLDGSLRLNIARRFPNLGEETLFDIYINNKIINLEDRLWYSNIQFMWYFGAESEPFTKYCKRLEKHFAIDNVVSMARGHTVSGWLATTFLPSDVDVDQRIIPIYAQNKLIQRDVLYDYKNYKLSSSYLIGEIYAPFMDVDTEPDIILSDRQRVNPNDLRYIALREYVVEQVEAIDRVWNRLRQVSPNRRPRKRTPLTLPPPQHNGGTQNVNSQTGATGQNYTEPPQTPPDVGSNAALSDSNSQALFNNPVLSDGTPSPPTPIGGMSPPRISEAPPKNPTGTAYIDMERLVKESAVEKSFRERICADLKESRSCYDNSAYKACVVMLGAVLEGVMLGVIRQPNVLNKIASTTFTRGVENVIGPAIGYQPQRARLSHNDLAEKMAEELKFEMLRHLVEALMPGLDNLRVDHIQHFRNAVHPWKGIKEPTLFGNIDVTRATQYIMACKIIIGHLTGWTP